MAIKSFTPLQGTWAGREVDLPTLSRPDTYANPDIDKSGGGLVIITEGTGDYDSSGLGPLPWGSGQLYTILHIHPAWLLKNGYTADAVGLEKATQKMDRVLYKGGSGYLKDVPPTGTINIDTGGPITYYLASCKIYGQPKWMPSAVSDGMISPLIFYCPSGLWIASDNTTRSFGLLSP